MLCECCNAVMDECCGIVLCWFGLCWVGLGWVGLGWVRVWGCGVVSWVALRSVACGCVA